MLTLIEDNKEFNYRVYRSSVIEKNHLAMKEIADIAYKNFKTVFPDKDSTWDFRMYNAFLITSPTLLYTELLKDVVEVIDLYSNKERPLWLQSWINYHMPHDVLDWHDHGWPYHGYISIDPKNTVTEFEGYTIENKIGNIYIGPGFRKHRVVVKENFTEPRMTMGFDVCSVETMPQQWFSLMPIV